MTDKEIKSVPIAQIRIANPRPRNRARWQNDRRKYTRGRLEEACHPGSP
jgi:hypothetical protein